MLKVSSEKIIGNRAYLLNITTYLVKLKPFLIYLILQTLFTNYHIFRLTTNFVQCMILSDLLGCGLWKNIVQRNKELKKIKFIVPSATTQCIRWMTHNLCYLLTYLKPNVGTYLLSSLFLIACKSAFKIDE